MTGEIVRVPDVAALQMNAAKLLSNAVQIVILVHGAEKAKALRAVLEGPNDPDRLPAQLIHPTHGRLIWLVHPAAARLLSRAEAVELPS